MTAFDELYIEIQSFTMLRKTRYKDISDKEFYDHLNSLFIVLHKEDIARLDLKMSKGTKTIIDKTLL